MTSYVTQEVYIIYITQPFSVVYKQCVFTEIQEALELLERVGEGPRDKVVMGACVVALKQDSEAFRFALLPGGDASEVASEWGAIWVLSPQAPLVRPFLGAEEGDEVEVLSTSRQGLWEVAEVR